MDSNIVLTTPEIRCRLEISLYHQLQRANSIAQPQSKLPAFLLGMLNITIIFPLPSNGLGFSSNANSDMRTFPKCNNAAASALQALTSGSQPLHPMACTSAPETRSCPGSCPAAARSGFDPLHQAHASHAHDWFSLARIQVIPSTLPCDPNRRPVSLTRVAAKITATAFYADSSKPGSVEPAHVRAVCAPHGTICMGSFQNFSPRHSVILIHAQRGPCGSAQDDQHHEDTLRH